MILGFWDCLDHEISTQLKGMRMKLTILDPGNTKKGKSNDLRFKNK